ncbi:hypothetical protein BBJ28_00010855 [Nothophytophthora sp. Chile5]|nr:hypothetical protein BBJ28_00010855 [Nothophytophthora sp. Chile5]
MTRFLAKMRFWLWLLLLQLLHVQSVYAAGATVAATWTNSSAGASSGLELQVTTGDAPLLPVDAVLTIQLNALFTVAGDASLDTSALNETLDGTWNVTVTAATQTLVIARNGDGSEVSVATLLRLALTGVTNPLRAGLIDLGMLELSGAMASFSNSLQLPTMQIDPGAIWLTGATFSNLLSGRNASLTVRLMPSHSVPNGGLVSIALPYIYGSLSGVTLSSVVGLDGQFELSTRNNQVVLHRVAASGTDSVAMQMVMIQLEGVVHPLLEGPVGPSVLLQTLDTSSRMIDQTYVDMTAVVLARARVLVGASSLRVDEGNLTGAQYTLALSAPPTGETAITISVGGAESRAKLTIEPTSVEFTASNWAVDVVVTVIAPEDHVVSGIATTENVVVINHSIISGDLGGTFAVVNAVDVHVSENDLPAVHISDRFAAVVEGLRNDSYEISLLSQPSSDVVIDLSPRDAFISTVPAQVVFTAASWNVPQVVDVVALLASSTRSAISGILHHITSMDANYNAKDDEVFPQNQVLVYYEAMESCVEPCRGGWFLLVNTTTGDSQCVGCPLGLGQPRRMR